MNTYLDKISYALTFVAKIKLSKFFNPLLGWLNNFLLVKVMWFFTESFSHYSGNKFIRPFCQNRKAYAPKKITVRVSFKVHFIGWQVSSKALAILNQGIYIFYCVLSPIFYELSIN